VGRIWFRSCLVFTEGFGVSITKQNSLLPSASFDIAEGPEGCSGHCDWWLLAHVPTRYILKKQAMRFQGEMLHLLLPGLFCRGFKRTTVAP
jgi:hypothetical protein